MSNGDSWSGVALSISIVPASAPGPKARPAAARHPDAPQPSGRISGKDHPAAERVGLWHAVQHQQRPARRIAAQPAQGDALRRRMRGTAVRAAELLEPGDVGEDILQPLRGILRDPVAVDRHHVQRAVAGLVAQAPAGDDDGVGLGRLRGEGAGASTMASRGRRWNTGMMM